MKTEPQPEHKWLQKLVGDWRFETEAEMKPGEAPFKSGGSEKVRSLGGLWIVCEAAGEIPGSEAATWMLTLGFDPQKKRFVGSWAGSMMTHLWVYDGGLDGAKRVLTLDTDGPAMSGEGTDKYRDVIEIVSDDERLLRAQVLKDGEWKEFMKTTYRRSK